MREFIITEDNNGQRLDRFLTKLLPNAPKGLIQKSIRKKNIKINNKRVSSNVYLNKDDIVSIFFSDETLEKFMDKPKSTKRVSNKILDLIRKPAYEDDNFIVVNKPVGILTQPDNSNAESISDAITVVLGNSSTFNPAPLNRLDRNTSGIIIIPKNYNTQKKASLAIREKDTSKKYRTIVSGKIDKAGFLRNKYSKNEQNNKASLNNGDTEVYLEYKPIKYNDDFTLLEIDLYTGKSHQIRAQLAGAGFPIVGDFKYGDNSLNQKLKNSFGLDHQLLHAYNYKLYNNNQELLNVVIDEPEEFKTIESKLLGDKWDIGKNSMD